MTIEKMTNEELVKRVSLACGSESLKEYEKCKVELLRQLEQGKRAVEAMERMKCCGNCIKNGFDKCHHYETVPLELGCEYPINDRYCPQWQSDGLTRKDRGVK
jgi:hypothetical protein